MSLLYLMFMLMLTSLTAIAPGVSSAASSPLPPSSLFSSSFMATENDNDGGSTVEDVNTDGTVELLDTANRSPAISHCDNKKNTRYRQSRRLLYVSTLDGRLTALDIVAGGKVHWSVPTEPGPLLSSNIHRLELTNNGRFVRMIPSLSGGIYKFDGDSIEPIPITGENLLSSSAKFSDDLVISGGKEIRTYGVSARTGKVIYECSMDGCVNSTDVKHVMDKEPLKGSKASQQQRTYSPADLDNYNDNYDDSNHDPLLDDVIVIRRQTQTVRAVETRTGIERWNFSVGHHELDLVQSNDCHKMQPDELDLAISNLNVKVVVPEGVICVFNEAQPQVMLWKHKFEHPIVSAWKMGADNQLHSIDMFSSVQWHWNEDENINTNTNVVNENEEFNVPLEIIPNPSIYIGMYDKQLYIQESLDLRSQIFKLSNSNVNLLANNPEKDTRISLPKIPWRPVAANSRTLALIASEDVNEEKIYRRGQRNELVLYRNSNAPSTANDMLSSQSILNASEYVDGNGFYLYTQSDLSALPQEEICNKQQTQEEDEQQQQQKSLPSLENGAIVENKTPTINRHKALLPGHEFELVMDDIEAPVKVVMLSLWFWWKEIAVIAFTSAILVNLLIGTRRRSEREIVVIERHIPVPTAIEATESNILALQNNTAILSTANSNILATSSIPSVSDPSYPAPSPGTNPSNPNNQNNHVPIVNPTGVMLTTQGQNDLANGGPNDRTISESTSHSSEHFCSRFQSDFDLMRCLGRGGFGVVFEAKNKLDDCRYAIKRITLPNKEESRARVMREVKTLANCEHQNIVRYFQSWVEKPPLGWQEEEDRKWLANEASTSLQIYTPTSENYSQVITPTNDGIHLNFDHRTESNTTCSDKVCGTGAKSKKTPKQKRRTRKGLFGTDSGYNNEDGKSLLLMQSNTEEEDSSIIFRSESQDDNIDSSLSEDNAVNVTAKEIVSIDIQSSGSSKEASSSEASSERWARKIDCSEPSDSFQIEFIGPSNDEDGEEDITDTKSNAQKKTGNKEHSKRSPSYLTLDMSAVEAKRCAERPATVAVSAPPSRALQNKVYLYIQMQLCRKESLKDWLKDNRIEDRSDYISSIFHQIVDAVDYVHYKGLIHRDLKPSNIFFSQDGQVKIGDFGLVTDMADIPNMESSKFNDEMCIPSYARHTQQVGTHLYMSPEQVQGLPYDYKVDIYSLGLIFFELLVFFGTEMERILTLRALRDGRYPNGFAQQHPQEYNLLQKMLSSQPNERPATHELKIQLNDILKIPDVPGESDTAALIAAARRLSRSRTFSSSFE